jgi:hypothetical protein
MAQASACALVGQQLATIHSEMQGVRDATHGPWAMGPGRAYQRVFFRYQEMKLPPPALGKKKKQKKKTARWGS